MLTLSLAHRQAIKKLTKFGNSKNCSNLEAAIMPQKSKFKNMVTNTPANTKPSATLKVSAVQIVDIRDNMLKYVTIENTNGGKVVINVGNKTYNAVKEIIQGTQKTTSPQELKK